jgi:hypothetical protein
LITGAFANGDDTTQGYESSICDANIPGLFINNDGFYGTLNTIKNGVTGSTYWGNTTAFDGCADLSYVCTAECAKSPVIRTRPGQDQVFTRNTGYWSRNWGMLNCCRLFNSDIAEYYFKSGNGLGGPFAGYKAKFGATGYAGFTANFFLTSSTSASTAKTTIAEACSAYNRNYYSTEEMKANGYPQVSRWYVPSVDELSFIAKQCTDSNVLLQQKIYNYNGSATGIPIGSNDIGATGWVWTSTGSFDEGITAQYIQATGGTPFKNINNQYTEATPGYYNQVSTNQFTKAWALKFPQFDINIQSASSSTDFRVKKAHDFNDKYEVRMVRLVRCDQKYYDNNNSVEFTRNRTWMIARLTDAAICNGTNQPDLNGIITQYNSTNIVSDPQYPTIYNNQQ